MLGVDRMSNLEETTLIEYACDTQRINDLLLESDTLDPLVRGLTAQTAEVVRHKPGRRCLIKYSCIDTSGTPMELLGKVRFKGLDRRSAEIQRTLAARYAASDGRSSVQSVVVPRVYGTLPWLKMWLQEFVPRSTPLSVDSANFLAIQPNIAEAIARLHQTQLIELEHHTVDKELSSLQRRFLNLRQTHPELNTLVDRLETKVHTVVNELGASQVQSVIHRDFYFDQILLMDSQVVLVDFDLCCLGPPELDIGNYIGHLREYSRRFPKFAMVCKSAEDAFTRAYFTHMPQTNYQAIQGWTTLTLARHVALSTLLPGRSHTTRTLAKDTIDN